MADEVVFTNEQQELVNKLVGEARTKARDKATVDFEAQALKEKGEAETAALATQEEWEKLAKQHESRVKELEPFEAQAQAYQVLMESMLKNKVKELGDKAKKAVEALPESMSALDKLNWLNENEGLFEAVGDGVGTPYHSKKMKKTKVPLDQVKGYRKRRF